MPILSATSEETDKLHRTTGRADEAIDVNGGEIAAAGSGDVKAEPMPVGRGEELLEGLANETFNLALATELVLGTIFPEDFKDFAFFKVEPLDLVFVAAAFDSGPIDYALGAAHGIAHVFLFENFRNTGSVFAVLKELGSRDPGAADLINFFDQAGVDGVDQIDAVVRPAAAQ